MENDLSKCWKVDTPNLLRLLLEDKLKGTVLIPSLRIFLNLLIELTERALVINDKELNDILLRLNLIEENKEE